MNFRASAVLLAAIGCAACGGARDEVSGTYMLDQPAGAGCTLGARLDEPRAVHLQLRCTSPSPAPRKGDLVAMAAVRDGEALYRTDAFGPPCELRFRFRGAKAVVTQTGSATACGFPPGAVIGGAYRRTSRDVWALPELRRPGSAPIATLSSESVLRTVPARGAPEFVILSEAPRGLSGEPHSGA